MSQKFRVQFFWGNYAHRQAAANAAGAIAYVEQHFNSSSDPAAGGVEVLVASNASTTSRRMARMYAAKCSAAFATRLRHPEESGLVVLQPGMNGHGNLFRTNMPAMLLESCFVSNPNEAAKLKTPEGQMILAECLADTIKAMFPDGGLIAFSVGHKGKTSSPADRGANVVGGGTEAEYAERVLLKAKAILEA